ncbi:glycosyltransferase [Arthrobacter sp. CDRTa11]|uniref:glycosyltransferase family 2 protein n=1 Tax=Arthrobacter sp. CDRTa11 TaxID=2651199 RepID=UPI002265C91B|nr:glycosyltransferase [Arthrobacter sp. CDRTa11]UZX05178.1 glycosyltransferase [Arthrobacter sp. CDRTa11]
MSAGLVNRSAGAIRMAPERLERRPLVSVVVPCFNYARFLPDAVASAVNQADVDVEVFIVDDASTDGSAELTLQLAAADPRIHPVLHSANLGHIATYNDGLARTTGDYVVLLSADDVLAPGSLARSAALMERHPGVGLVYGFAQEFSDTPPSSFGGRSSWSIWGGEDWIGIMCRRGSNIIVNPEAVVRRSVLEQLGGYRSDMPHAADMEFWLRAAAISDVGRVNGPTQAYYRVHGGNMHLTDFGSALDDIRARRQVFDELCSLGAGGLTRPRHLLRTARRALAVEAVRSAVHLADTQGAQHGSASELAAFASETDADIAGSGLWASHLRRQHGNASPARRLAAEFLYRWRWSLRWRRWRRSGI